MQKQHPDHEVLARHFPALARAYLKLNRQRRPTVLAFLNRILSCCKDEQDLVKWIAENTDEKPAA